MRRKEHLLREVRPIFVCEDSTNNTKITTGGCDTHATSTFSARPGSEKEKLVVAGRFDQSVFEAGSTAEGAVELERCW